MATIWSFPDTRVGGLSDAVPFAIAVFPPGSVLNPAESVGEAASARITALKDQLHRYRTKHENVLTALPFVEKVSAAHRLLAPSHRTLEQMDADLKKIANGTSSLCVSCQRYIPARRFDNQPYLLECIACSLASTESQ